MSSTAPPTTYAETLMNFWKDVGISEHDAQEPESPFAYKLNVSMGAGKLNATSAPGLINLLSLFKESIKITVGSVTLTFGNSVIEVDGVSVSGDATQRLTEVVNQYLESELELELIIDKRLLITMIGLDETRFNCLFYLFKQKLIRVFREPLLRLDDLLFERSEDVANPDAPVVDKPTVIMVSDADIHFAGEMLTIIGERNLRNDPGLLALLQGRSSNEFKGAVTAEAKTTRPDQLAGCLSLLKLRRVVSTPKADLLTVSDEKPVLTAMTPALREHIRKYRAAAQEYPSLVGQKFKHLTPLHFLGQWKTTTNGEIETELALHFLNICILYTANRSTFNNNQKPLQSVYTSSDRTTTLSLEQAPTSPVSTATLESLTKWLYSGNGVDQRTVFQNIIAREVYADDATASYNSFIARIPRLWKDTAWQYQVFIEGKITKHFEELQKVIGYIADVTKKISEAIDSITKSLTDALLATVGVVVLTVLAALVKKETSIEVFKISMEIYSIYLLFYAVYRMGSIGHSYRLLSEEASAQLDEYEAALRVEEITDLSLPLKRRRRQFHIWFWLTVALYLGLAGSIWLAGKKGPQLLIDRSIITAPGAKTNQTVDNNKP